MTETYPIMVNLENKVVVVIGGGQVAYRKILGLINTDALITVISPVIHIKINELVATNQITWKRKLFEPKDLDDALLIIAATNHKVVNEHVALSAKDHQLVNVVHNQEMCDFHVPAKLTRGDLTITVATGGTSPTLAKKIRDEIGMIYDSSYEDYLNFLKTARERIKQLHMDQDLKTTMLRNITDFTYRTSIKKQEEFLKLISSYG